MRKKGQETDQETPSNGKKIGDFKVARPGQDERNRVPKATKLTDDPRFAQAVQNYEAGLKALQGHKYDKAKAFFEKVVGGPSPELRDRAAIHLNTCNQHINRDSTTFKTPEEKYDYAVSLMNTGDYVGARDIFNELTQQHPTLDFVWYGSAALNCLMGHFPDAISGLNEAIRLNPANRFQARNDSDFKTLADDPRFTELLYPDTSAEVPPETQKWHF
jgi:tetratricopeptide (TPR) repeat protein